MHGFDGVFQNARFAGDLLAGFALMFQDMQYVAEFGGRRVKLLSQPVLFGAFALFDEQQMACPARHGGGFERQRRARRGAFHPERRFQARRGRASPPFARLFQKTSQRGKTRVRQKQGGVLRADRPEPRGNGVKRRERAIIEPLEAHDVHGKQQFPDARVVHWSFHVRSKPVRSPMRSIIQ